MFGRILAPKSISLATGATLNGRALAHLGAVTLADNTVHLAPITVGLSALAPITSTSDVSLVGSTESRAMLV